MCAHDITETVGVLTRRSTKETAISIYDWYYITDAGIVAIYSTIGVL